MDTSPADATSRTISPTSSNHMDSSLVPLPTDLSDRGIEAAISHCQAQELAAPNCVPVPSVYLRLLSLHLVQNDLCSAKWLWKRIPECVKSTTPELQALWRVGAALWQQDPPVAFLAMRETTWSPEVNELVRLLEQRWRTRTFELVERSYSYITSESLSHLTGVSCDEVKDMVLNRGWSCQECSTTDVPGQTSIADQDEPSGACPTGKSPSQLLLFRVRPPERRSGNRSRTDDDLVRLTDTLSFLET